MKSLLVLMVVAAIPVMGCSKGTGTASSSADATTGANEATILATADGADGTVDHVVSRCAVCNLAMDGSAEHKSTHAGYEFHLCSAHCKETFDHDPGKAVARLQPTS